MAWYFRLTSSTTMRSVAIVPESRHSSWFWLVTPVAQMKTGMNMTVTTASIIKVAKMGESAFLFLSAVPKFL